MKEKKLLVLDLDGTLTNSKKEVSERTKKAIACMQQEGHVVILASGRPTAGIEPIANILSLAEKGGYCLAFNGARIVDCKQGEVIYQQTLDHQYLPRLYTAAVKYGLTLLTYKGQDVWAGTEINEYARLESKINHMNIQYIENFVEAVDFPINKCLMTGEPEKVKACLNELSDEYGQELSIYRSEDFFLEVMPMNIDKAASLARLLDYLDMDKKDMICCGDGYNDQSMIEFAGLGVAMANAKEEVKQAADVVTLSNDEDGLVPIIENYILGRSIDAQMVKRRIR